MKEEAMMKIKSELSKRLRDVNKSADNKTKAISKEETELEKQVGRKEGAGKKFLRWLLCHEFIQLLVGGGFSYFKLALPTMSIVGLLVF